MDHPRASPWPAGLPAGRLDGTSVPELLWELARRRATGVLELRSADVRKSLQILDGRVVFASSSDPDDRLGELLLREELIVLRDLEDVLSQPQPPGKRIGTLLVEDGRLSPKGLVRGVVSQIQEIALELFAWESGEYRFHAGPLPTDEPIVLPMPTAELILHGIRRVRSFGRLRRAVGPLRAGYRLAEGWRAIAQAIQMPEGAQAVMYGLEQAPKTVEELCDEVLLSHFETYQTLWALKILGVVEETDRHLEVASAPAGEGLIGRQGAAPALLRLCRAGETGVLELSRGSLERALHLREGQCVFATSNDLEDGLLAQLLRRGVISARDRDRAAKRLLSNKRAGTILSGLGAIDDEDVARLVREQLRELLHDTLAWDSGEYRFVAGELPTLEEITLEDSLESIVATALRRVSSWTRIRKGCGGLHTRLILTPRYLDVLDRLEIGAEEWEIVSTLARPHTPMELCEKSSLGDFAVCQTLWILKVLGAIEDAPATAEGERAETPHAQDLPLVTSGLAGSGHPERPAGVAGETKEPLLASEPASHDVAAWPDPAVEVPVPGAGFEGAPEPAAAAGASHPDGRTLYIPREEVEAALALGRSAEARELPEDGKAVVTLMLEIPAAPERARIAEERPQPVDDGPTSAFAADEADKDVSAAPAPPPGSATCQIPREEVEAALTLAAAAVAAEPASAPWEPPEELEIHIARVNARQRLLYRTIRGEVGAGAANFVRSCTARLPVWAHRAFVGAQLDPDGSWDAESLRRAVHEQRVRDPWPAYRALLDLQLDTLRQHLGAARADALRRQILMEDVTVVRQPRPRRVGYGS
jgi:hypothetical protein